jgi:general secretion pathway protein G
MNSFKSDIRSKTRRRSGFTFLEIMLVVVIIGMLMALVGPAIVGQAKQAQIKTTSAQISDIENALGMYEMRIGSFPTTEQGLEALLKCPDGVDKNQYGDAPYMKKMPLDAWKRKFIYKSPGEHSKDYDLYSKGPDGNEGTDDDIVNWDQETNTDSAK